MTPAIFIISISLYLVSLVAALMAALFSSFIPSRLINTLIIFHVLSILVWFIIPLTGPVFLAAGSGYLFLCFFCSGIIIAGMILRKKYHLAMKIYFMMFISSVLVFLVSPSRVIGFISTGQLNAINPERIYLGENYFFVEQNEHSSPTHSDSIAYKLIREMGFFHKTLSRDIILPSKVDSARITEFYEKENIFVKVYSGTHNFELNIPISKKGNKIETIKRKSDS